MQHGSHAEGSGLSSEDVMISLSSSFLWLVLQLLHRTNKISNLPTCSGAFFKQNNINERTETKCFRCQENKFTFLFNFLRLSNIQKEQTVIWFLRQQTPEIQKDAIMSYVYSKLSHFKITNQHVCLFLPDSRFETVSTHYKPWVTKSPTHTHTTEKQLHPSNV